MMMQEKKKGGWVKVDVIREMTGWDSKKTHQARKYGYVHHKKDKDGIWYDIDSFHPHFIKEKERDKDWITEKEALIYLHIIKPGLKQLVQQGKIICQTIGFNDYYIRFSIEDYYPSLKKKLEE